MSSLALKLKDHVKNATPSSINAEIENKMWNRVAELSNADHRRITTRINQLEKEWDVERYLGVNMGALALSGIFMTRMTKNIKWLALPSAVLGFFMQHSIQGWCPPLPFLRMLGIRTRKEIEQEKYALKFIRGDFENVDNLPGTEIEKLKQAVKN